MRRSLSVVCFFISFIVVLSLAQAVRANGVGEEIGFPYLLEIASGNVLFVHGHEFRDQVWIDWIPGDSLRVEGMAVYPLPPVEERVMSEDQFAQTYGRVPYVRHLVDAGSSWEESSKAYLAERERVRSEAIVSYFEVIDSSGSHEEASLAVLSTIDRTLLEPDSEPEISRSSIVLFWDGSVTEHVMLSKRTSGPPYGKPVEISENLAVAEARRLISWLDGRYSNIYVVLVSPRLTTVRSGESALEALAQIEQARTGTFVDGPIDRTELLRIRRLQGGERE